MNQLNEALSYNIENTMTSHLHLSILNIDFLAEPSNDMINKQYSKASAYPPIYRWIKTAALYLLLLIQISCSGGNGSGDGKSVAGTDLSNNFSGFDVPIFYVRRVLPENDLSLETPYAFNPGAHLFLRSTAAASASDINITARIFGDDAEYDVKDLDISPDGQRLLFAMHPPEVDPDNPIFTWDIWEYTIASDTLRRVISDEFIAIKGQGHDIDPAYLPTPDPNQPEKVAIVFSSTRQITNQVILLNELKGAFTGLSESSARQQRDLDNGAIQALSLHIYDETLASGEEMRQITFNQSHDIDPLVLASGKILFNRWDNIAGEDTFSLYSTTALGAETTLMYGYHSNSTSGSNNGEAIITELQLQPDNTLLGLQRERDLAPNILGGVLVTLDINNYIDRNTPTFTNSGLLAPAFSPLLNTTVYTDDRLSPDGRFSSARPLNDGTQRYLVSWSPCLVAVNDEPDAASTPCSLNPNGTAVDPAYGIWLLDIDDPNDPLLQPIVLGETGFMFTDVMIAETREEAAFVLPPSDNFADIDNQPRAILNIDSIYDLDGIDISTGGLVAHADPTITHPSTINAKFLRLVKAVSIPDESIHEFENSAFGVSSAQLMREIIGYLPIEPDGSVRGLVPANVPFLISVVDANGKRLSQRHQNWLSLAPNETMQCRGCHTANSTEPHGRIDAQAPSANNGAPAPLGVFPNTEQNLGILGDTMAENFARFMLPDPAPEVKERRTTADLIYVDDWTDETIATLKAPSFTISYDNLTTANPENPFCKLVRPSSSVEWTPLCRIVINYEQHIQPIWEAIRTPIADGTPAATTFDSCVGCHTSNNGSRVPAAQLDLTASASDIEPDQLTSYRELLRADNEQAIDGGVITERRWECTTLDIDDMPVVNIVMPAQIAPSMSEAGANFNASPNFFNCLTTDNSCRTNFGIATPVDCVEIGGDPVIDDPANVAVNHNDLLSAEELRLIAEWLDIGAQYYNNPFDAPEP